MIRFVIENGNNWLKFDMPTCELVDHLGSIGICKDIPIGGTEKISVDYYPTEDDDKIAKIVCERLLPDDKISDVNRLCARLDGQWQITDEEFESAHSENDVRGALNIKAAYEKLREDLTQINDLRQHRTTPRKANSV
ncbi:MAG: hypothetical protein OSJ43_16060 [Oscillospiraceae bacterium]|nr:hypothetical protein [Oscillospiraceae bacterium]